MWITDRVNCLLGFSCQLLHEFDLLLQKNYVANLSLPYRPCHRHTLLLQCTEIYLIILIENPLCNLVRGSEAGPRCGKSNQAWYKLPKNRLSLLIPEAVHAVYQRPHAGLKINMVSLFFTWPSEMNTGLNSPNPPLTFPVELGTLLTQFTMFPLRPHNTASIIN